MKEYIDALRNYMCKDYREMYRKKGECSRMAF